MNSADRPQGEDRPAVRESLSSGAIPAHAPTSTPYVHVRVGQCDIAIAVDHVRQALALPTQGLVALPRRQGALSGLVDVDGSAVPVVALDRWLPMGDGRDAHLKRILVLRSGRMLIGVLVDAVLGVKAVAPDSLRRVHHQSSDEELFEAVLPATASTPLLSVLEVGRLMQLCGAWCEEAGVPAGIDPASQNHREATKPRLRHAVFELDDGELWAVPAGCIGRVVPTPSAELAMRQGHRTAGICEWENRKLPLVDLARRDASMQAASAGPWMAVIQDGPLAIGLAIRHCRRFVDLSEDDVAATPGDGLLAGLSVLDDLGRVRVLDVDKLFAQVPEASISHRSPRRAAIGAALQAQATEGSPSHYLVFEADRAYASPVNGVIGVVELPQEVIDDLQAGRRAALSWRGRSINVVKLPGIHDDATSALVPRLAVLVESHGEDAGPVGIAIRSLSDWLPARSASCSQMRMGQLGQVTILTAQQRASRDASLVVVDLAQMAYLLG